jgi:hypothetical protein
LDYKKNQKNTTGEQTTGFTGLSETWREAVDREAREAKEQRY